MSEPNNIPTITAKLALEDIAQLTKERAQLAAEKARLEECCRKEFSDAQKWSDECQKLTAKLKELQSHIRCIYCNEKYTAEEKEKLADHIMTCEKSPLVQMNAELMEVANLLIGSSDPDSVIIEVKKRIKSLPENTILKQRDDALDKLRLSEAQVVQLLDENNSLKLDYSHSEAENDQLAAKCAHRLECLKSAHVYISGVNADFERVPMDQFGLWAGADPDRDELLDRIDHALSDQCGEGWLSPEKAGRLREALLRIVDGKEDDPKDSNGISAGEISLGDLRAAKRALEACKI